ncbi:ATP-grasp domain-containing protein [Microbacterium sp.]|uniref:ATP-grasp domain-containing protein n=1 Tax=Microbacterium sp. TaxID=51671 RepID=UPI0039E22988
MTTEPAVYVIHDNPDWLPPFQRAFAAAGVPLVEWELGHEAIDLGEEPPRGVFWSRLSASAHTRDHAASKEYGRAVLRWLASWGRLVVNGADVLELEVSKVAQHAALRRAGVDVPRTTAVLGREGLVEAARGFPAPFITKHNQGGKGLGVRRFDSHDEFEAWVGGPDFEPSPDHITLVQEYLRAREPFITRAEFVNGELVYAVRVDTSAGGFELCPAEACAAPGADGTEPAPLFQLREEVDARHPLISALGDFLSAAGVAVAGVEFTETLDGRLVTYDVNTNTNYSPDVEAVAPRSGPATIARFLGDELRRLVSKT